MLRCPARARPPRFVGACPGVGAARASALPPPDGSHGRGLPLLPATRAPAFAFAGPTRRAQVCHGYQMVNHRSVRSPPRPPYGRGGVRMFRARCARDELCAPGASYGGERGEPNRKRLDI